MCRLNVASFLTNTPKTTVEAGAFKNLYPGQPETLRSVRSSGHTSAVRRRARMPSLKRRPAPQLSSIAPYPVRTYAKHSNEHDPPVHAYALHGAVISGRRLEWAAERQADTLSPNGAPVVQSNSSPSFSASGHLSVIMKIGVGDSTDLDASELGILEERLGTESGAPIATAPHVLPPSSNSDLYRPRCGTRHLSSLAPEWPPTAAAEPPPHLHALRVSKDEELRYDPVVVAASWWVVTMGPCAVPTDSASMTIRGAALLDPPTIRRETIPGCDRSELHAARAKPCNRYCGLLESPPTATALTTGTAPTSRSRFPACDLIHVRS
ncbi:hypothetical protein V8D89_008828 [Ganoderma adspersum]